MDGWILGTLGTSPSASEPEDDRLAPEFRSSPIGATLTYLDTHEDEQPDEAQFAG
jgi:hypothetical protein